MLLERFKQMHEQVDFEIGLQMSGLAAVYGSKAIPRSLQGRIDALFAGSGLLASQRLDQADAAASRVEEDARRQIDAQIQKEIEVAKAEMAAASGPTSRWKNSSRPPRRPCRTWGTSTPALRTSAISRARSTSSFSPSAG
jgi:hypothetical protein